MNPETEQKVIDLLLEIKEVLMNIEDFLQWKYEEENATRFSMPYLESQPATTREKEKEKCN